MRQKITKELLENLLNQGLSTNKIGKQLGYSGYCIRYNMEKWALSSIHKSIRERTCYITETHKKCPKCSKIKELRNFGKRSNGSIRSHCKKCVQDSNYSSLKLYKIMLINEFGGSCSKCGYNKNTSALEFHHLDPKQKEYHLGNPKTTNIDKIRKEIDKCILVCANCHREIHYPQNNI